MSTPYPCECGADDVGPVVDQVDENLWRARVECSDCAVVGPERQAGEPDDAERAAVAEWNAMRLIGRGI